MSKQPLGGLEGWVISSPDAKIGVHDSSERQIWDQVLMLHALIGHGWCVTLHKPFCDVMPFVGMPICCHNRVQKQLLEQQGCKIQIHNALMQTLEGYLSIPTPCIILWEGSNTKNDDLCFEKQHYWPDGFAQCLAPNIDNPWNRFIASRLCRASYLASKRPSNRCVALDLDGWHAIDQRRGRRQCYATTYVSPPHPSNLHPTTAGWMCHIKCKL